MIGARGVLASTIQTYPWIVSALVNIDASVSRRRQRVTVITLALEGSIHVNAVAIITHSCVLTFIVVSAIFALSRDNEPWWAVASEASLVIATSASLTVAQQTLVNVLAPASPFGEAGVAIALVSVLGIDALAVPADIRPEGALVYHGDRLQLLQAQPVVIVASGIRTDEALVAPPSTHVLPAAAVLFA